MFVSFISRMESQWPNDSSGTEYAYDVTHNADTQTGV